MTRTDDARFIPPTDDQVRSHLDRHAPRPPSRFEAWLPVIVLASILAAAFALGGTLGVLLPWVMLAGLLLHQGRRQRAIRDAEQKLTQAYELTVLRRPEPCVRLIWRLLPRLSAAPPLHARAVAMLAHNLDQLKAYDSALVAYDRVIDHLPSAHPWSIQLRIQRALAHLANHQLTLADEALRRLRTMSEQITDAATQAALLLAQLVQGAYTNHWEDAVSQSTDLVEKLRPLGVDAAIGHGLAALAHQQLSLRTQDAALMRQAQHWWRLATTLLPPEELVRRLPQLRAAADALPAAERPLN